VKRKVTQAERKRLVAAPGLQGVGIVPEYQRVYPHGQLGAQLLGFVGIDERGLEGLERTLDGALAGEGGYATFQRDAAGRLISAMDMAGQPAHRGSDVVLSLDTVIQGYAEAALQEAWELWAPRAAVAVVLDPRTADVLAAASLPSFDPNRYRDYGPNELKHRARARYIVDWMEPGSIMKPFVLSGALNERLVHERSVIFCENGVWLIGSRRFHDHHAYGHLSGAEVIIKSSNIGAAKIGKRLGPQRLYRYLCGFGFGRSTAFILPGENPGRLRPPSAWTSYSLPSVSIGQEVCVNALQMALAYAAIANDGVLMRPRVVRRIRRRDGTWLRRPARAVRRVIPVSVARRVRRVLLRTVEEGTGRRSRLAPYTVGGKTGTGQKPAADGGFSHTAVICSFAGMAPIERPRLVVLVSVDEPTKREGGRHFGGTVAAPIVGRILKQSLAYLGVRPDKPDALARLGLAAGGQRAIR
jgi:cell division protein FtsI (penicillin-binding protein 3)